MPAFMGADFELHVETSTPDTYILVADLNSFSRNTSRDNQTFPVFGSSIAYVIPGAREVTYTAAGFLSTDAGQERLRTVEQSDTPVKIKVLWDGANGFTQEVRVSSTTQDATPEGLQEVSYEFAATAAAVIVGTGPLV